MTYFLYAPFAFLWWLGGGKQPWTRDILIPILAGGTMLIRYHGGFYDFLMCFLTVGSYQIIRLGYGAYDPEHDPKPSFLAKITHDRSGAYIRSIYCGLVGLIGLLPYEILTLHHLHYLGYTVICSLTGFLVVKLKSNRLVTDLNIGIAVGNIILL